jgi:alpha,alpha-trehalose phosphorylase
MGGVWQALAFGFVGLRPRGDVLELDPRLPPSWRALELRVVFRGSRVRIRVEPDAVTAAAEPAVRLRLLGGEQIDVPPGGARLAGGV